MIVRQSSFHGGEVAPNLFSRTDIESRRAAVRTLRNFFPTPTGAAMNRAGFQYIAPLKDQTRKARLIPFTFSTSQAYLLEFGHLYVRVYQGGVFVTEVATTYTDAQLPLLQYVQSADTLTLTHPSHPVRELKRTGASTWTLTDFSVLRSTPAPAAPTFANVPLTTPDDTHQVKEWDWVVTVVKNDEEGMPSSKLSSTCQLAPDRPVNLQVAAVTGAQLYYWYRGRYGVYGFVGSSQAPLFIDDGQTPNYSDRPPSQRNPVGTSAEYPAVATYFQQRLAFANQAAFPQRIITSQTGRYHNFDYSLPQKKDDALDFTVASRQFEEIRALVPLQQLAVLTANTEFVVDSGDAAVGPDNFTVIPVSYNGSSWMRPIVVGDSILFVQAQNGAVRELVFGGDKGWAAGDISLVANHLLAASNRSVVDWAYQRLPYSIAWIVRDDGALLSLTYSRDFNVAAWARHDTDGWFESVCALPEGSEDALYAIVRRTVNGQTKRYIERQSTRHVTDVRYGNFLDSSRFYEGAPAQVFSALGHLEGKSVTVLRDGQVEGPHVVTGGSITLSAPGSVVFIGLPYDADIELLDLAIDEEEVSADQKLVTRVVWEVDRTAGLQAGEAFAALTPWVAPLGYVMPAEGIANERFIVPISSSWNLGGRAVLRQSNPLPVTVIGASRDVAFGGN
jgi:hypothetical protein